ncbi:Na+/H+ antiporter subunit E [Actinophytocola algeriensis]|uniref:Multicomponent Na+:H+ antiporter subunit E n=1 Tax=Actinophytocola algeriensis TaxID=1768010 RepID=A0A7W7VG51_9PSEU|nr:Na+/H+ antiporter subunit E [Actinophytocola algeriensis]MBB4908774.1 multicomponent Na+:H+ antiporter subunit E [Actinophytocola algeriensis]MBE1474839.1 multicomponent Na+:H+ antiporter subunit E [Actinophytocola algeriensis]
MMVPPLALFWLVLSGHYTFLLIVLGAVSVVLVCWLAWRADFPERDDVVLPLSPRLPRYVLWLGKEVLVSAVAVVRKVWSPRPDLRPVVGVTPSPDMSVFTQVVYANSITLTPGTLSLDVDEDRIEVHSLDAEDVDVLRDGEMMRRARGLETRR